ncbi:hypothetical protein BJX68DRAFT_236934 [Aspergillus pseudodeflectus]|uniref:F-box domain-containing protein n=1 Tax=Aspergillus pseudodeflectus TaxID=176178 RepID=A0ABR4KDR4_9EURO
MDRLPTELVLAIAGEVPEQTDRLNLLRVCRTWRDTLLEAVYSAVELETLQIPQLIETLLGNAQIALSVRRIDVLDRQGIRQRPDYPPLNADVRALVDKIAKSPQKATEWCTDLHGSRPDAWMALLLALVPNLTTLTWGAAGPSLWMSTVVLGASYREPPFDTQPALQSLSRVEFTIPNPDDLTDSIEFIEIASLVKLPSLRHLSMEKVKDGPDIKGEFSEIRTAHLNIKDVVGTSPIETLKISAQSNLNFGSGFLISACANLREFVYQHENQVEELGYRDFRVRAFRNPLLGQTHSLEVLHLNDKGEAGVGIEEPDDADDFDPADRWFGSFAEFEKLRDLRIRAQNLLNLHPMDNHRLLILKDVLPMSLKWLHVAHCDEAHSAVLADGLLGVLSGQKELFPDLEQIYIYSAVAESSQPQPAGPHRPPADVRVLAAIDQHFTPIQAMCKRAGIAFNLSLRDDYKIVYLGGNV